MTEKESEVLFVPHPVPCFNPSPVLTFSSSGRGETAHCFLVGLGPRRSTKRWAPCNMSQKTTTPLLHVLNRIGLGNYPSPMPVVTQPLRQNARLLLLLCSGTPASQPEFLLFHPYYPPFNQPNLYVNSDPPTLRSGVPVTLALCAFGAEEWIHHTFLKPSGTR